MLGMTPTCSDGATFQRNATVHQGYTMMMMMMMITTTMTTDEATFTDLDY